jgi:hypothetical protein
MCRTMRLHILDAVVLPLPQAIAGAASNRAATVRAFSSWKQWCSTHKRAAAAVMRGNFILSLINTFSARLVQMSPADCC